MGLPSHSHKTAAAVDAGSRYGEKVTQQPAMHGAGRWSEDEVLQARKEAARLNKRSSKKWIDAVEKGEMVRVEQILDDGEQDINEVCEPQMSSALSSPRAQTTCAWRSCC